MPFNPWISKSEDAPGQKPTKKPAGSPPRKLGVPPPAPPAAPEAAEPSYAARFTGGKRPAAPATNAAATYAQQFAGGAQADKETSIRDPERREVEAVAAAVPAAETKGSVPNRALLHALEEKRLRLDPESLPRLQRKVERQIQGNQRELSLVEGNLLHVDRALATIYVTSCFDGEGKTTTATHVGYGLAELARRNVLLIDSNGDSPRLHKFMCAPNETGLLDVLTGKVSPEEAILPAACEHLYVLPAGNGHIPLHGEAFRDLIRLFRANFDFVIIDGKSVLVSSGPSNVAPEIDLFLLVVECESTKWEVVQMAHEKLTQSGTRHTAVVLNRRRFYVPRAVYRLLSKR